MKYRTLRPNDLIRFGDERFDRWLGRWIKCRDRKMERFSDDYRRVGNGRDWRRPVKR